MRQDQDEPPPFSAALLERVRRTEGVAAATGGIFAVVRLVDSKNEQLGNGFAPNFVYSNVPDRFNPLTYPEGRAPRTAREIAIDKGTAERKGIKLGDSVGVAGDRSVVRYRVVGINEIGGTSFGGSASATLTLPEAARITDRRGKFDQLFVAGEDGVDAQTLRDRVRASCRAASGWRPPTSTPPARPTRSTRTSSACCAPSCWCSAAWSPWWPRS